MSFLPFLILQVVIFVALVVLLRRILSHNLTDATAHLQSLSAGYAKRHEELKQRLGEAEQQYREQMARAKVEAEQLIQQARQEAEASKTRLLEDARTESERIVHQGLQSQDALRKEIEQKMESRATERACEIIQEVLPGQLRREIQSHWLDELVGNGLAQLDRVQMAEHVQEARVVSAFPLNKDQRNVLRAWLKEKLGRDIPLNEEVDEQLVAGIVMTIGSLVLDGSLASKVRKVARHAHDAA